MKRELERIPCARTKNRHRCPWVRSLRRVGAIQPRELGKLAPYLRYKGCLLFAEQVAVTRGARLFNKNIGNSKPVRVCTVANSCPVAVRETLVQEDEAPLNGGGNYNPLKVA